MGDLRIGRAGVAGRESTRAASASDGSGNISGWTLVGRSNCERGKIRRNLKLKVKLECGFQRIGQTRKSNLSARAYNGLLKNFAEQAMLNDPIPLILLVT